MPGKLGPTYWLRKLNLFKRLPKLVYKQNEESPLIPAQEQKQYPDLEQDFGALEEKLLPRFHELEAQSLEAQNRYRRQQVTLIIGGAAASTLGAAQAAFSDMPWIGIAETILAAVLTAVAINAQKLNAQKEYFTYRVKAELLRGEYFLFLSRLDRYASDRDRIQNLIKQIADIEEDK